VERHVKERLIGAAVLAAAGIILIPEMLSGTKPAPGSSQSAITLPAGPASDGTAGTAQATSGEAPLKTYTIDLSRTPGQGDPQTADPHSHDSSQASADASANALDERAPPAEMPPAAESSSPAAAPAHQVTPESAAAVSPSAATSSAAIPSATGSAAVKPSVRSSAPNPPASSIAAPAAASTAPAKPAQATRGWAIQMGSFSSHATAERMVKQLQASGQPAFVMPVKSGSATLYRVRVGPMQDKQAAQQLLGKLKSVAAGARLVPHP